MGTQYRVTCKHCGKVFKASVGGGFMFRELYCNHCGRRKVVSVEQPGRDGGSRIAVPIPCTCGGQYTSEAKPRCPRCKSGDWSEADAVAEADYD